MEDHIVVLVTVPSRESGTDIARTLLERKLAACVNIVPSIKSLYTWEEELCTDDEVLLLIKTRRPLFEAELVPAVQEVHPYDIPEIVALPIVAGSREYLDWIDVEVPGANRERP
ncbi:MAG: divalent-cation tolerance protein CutA [Anaerolineae bacterium]|jgi:periplasmic divalent cation tolerance protein